ncbi:MAG: F0F1 ATP synthase subunit A [Chloroflexota bacterium]
MSNELVSADPQVQPSEADDLVQLGSDKRSRFSLRTLGLVLGGVILLNVLAFVLVPPFNAAQPDAVCNYPVCFIEGNIHVPAPAVLWTAGGEAPSTDLLTFQISISDSILTMFLVTALVLVLIILASRGRKPVPGFFQNFVEWAYESLTGFGRGMGGSRSTRYLPLFAAFFILILAFNWSGLIPPIGKIDGLRAPTSDLNVTAGLALVAFGIFQMEGVRHLGVRGYLAKFFPLYEFRKGIAAGIIAMFVGFIELFLEFIKPVTLSMRLFGNIFGGEVALGVVTGLFITLIPVALYGLEVILTFIQALIFSTLTLMFILAAIESHHHEEGHVGEEAVEALEDAVRHAPASS